MLSSWKSLISNWSYIGSEFNQSFKTWSHIDVSIYITYKIRIISTFHMTLKGDDILVYFEVL